MHLLSGRERGVAGIVLLSHVPPLLTDAHEPTGWANWPTATRERLLSLTQGKRVVTTPGLKPWASHSLLLACHASALTQTTLEPLCGKPPSLIVNGHFHANVDGVTTTEYGPTPLEVRSPPHVLIAHSSLLNLPLLRTSHLYSSPCTSHLAHLNSHLVPRTSASHRTLLLLWLPRFGQVVTTSAVGCAIRWNGSS